MESGASNQDQRQREAQLQAILDTAVEAIITIDHRGICQSANLAAEKMFGYAATEMVDQNVSMLMPAPDRDRHDEYLARYLQTGERKIIGIGREVVGRRKDGEEFPIHLAVSEVRVGKRRLFTGFIQDISQRKEAERRLLKSERLAVLGEAMARLAHEGRNSLQRIQIAVETARISQGDEQMLTQQLDAIERSSDGLDALLDELKNYAAPLSLQKTNSSLTTVWREAWQSTAHLRQDREVTLKETPLEDAAMCRVDRFRLGQVFRNLFENSLAVCDDPAIIELELRQRQSKGGNVWSITVRDNGPGLNDQQAQHVFEPFYTTKSRGTGLGLAISQRIVEAHGGSLSVGTGATTGAEFIVELPDDQ